AGAAGCCEDQRLILGAQHATRLWTANERLAVDDLDGPLSGVPQEDALAGQVDVAMVEAAVAKRRKADEAGRQPEPRLPRLGHLLLAPGVEGVVHRRLQPDLLVVGVSVHQGEA